MNETITYRGWKIEKWYDTRPGNIKRMRWTVYYPDNIRKMTGHKAYDKNSLSEAQTLIDARIKQYGTAKEYVATGEEWKEHTKRVAEEWDERITTEVKPETSNLIPQTSMSPVILVVIFIGVLGYLLFGSIRRG